MNLFHALTVEKAWVQTINGTTIDHYLNFDINDDFSNHFTFVNAKEEIVAILDPSETLNAAPSGPGFFLIKDQKTGNEVILELLQSIPLTIR